MNQVFVIQELSNGHIRGICSDFGIVQQHIKHLKSEGFEIGKLSIKRFRIIDSTVIFWETSEIPDIEEGT